MYRRFLHHKYLNKKLSKSLKALFANYIIIDLAAGFFAVFLPIFLYEFFKNNIQLVFSYYFAAYFLTLLAIVFWSKKLNKFGFRRSLKISCFVSAAYYACFYFLKPEGYWFLISVSIVLMALRTFLYWIPYNIDFAKFVDSKDRGKTMGLLEGILSVTGIITPLIAGFIIADFGFNALFLLGVIIFIVSYFPLVSLPRTREKFSWSVLKTINKIFAKENRNTALVFFSEGAESIVFVVVWPIFMFQVMKGNYLGVGFVSTLTVIITIMAQIKAGKKSDGTKKSKDKMVKYGGLFYALGWFLKVFILTAFHIFVIDLFHKLTQIFYKIPLNTLVFEKAAGQKHLIDEFVVFREICLNLGRITMLGVILIASFWISLNWLFVFGAIFALFEAFYHRNLYCSLR